ncbi:MAG TPA: tetratricopeptide repeat protein, partial [Verrucomicrobiae bacterium]|jgi:tetratricopeptide (TPR) repeat protein|nr:tetratricopeptide repeat protein [Verrucomicrobiae bacterium]
LLKNPTNTVVLLQKAELQVNLEQFDAAHRTLDRLLSVTPRDIPALLFQAFSFIQEKKFDQALLTVDKVLREDPENFQALTAKGIAHMELKDNDSARAAFDRVLRREPDNPVALRNRALLNVRTQRWGEAKDDYEHLEKLTPRAYAVMYGLADVAYNLKEYKKAARLYQDYLKFAPAKGTPELEEEKTKVRARLKEIESAPHQ